MLHAHGARGETDDLPIAVGNWCIGEIDILRTVLGTKSAVAFPAAQIICLYRFPVKAAYAGFVQIMDASETIVP